MDVVSVTDCTPLHPDGWYTPREIAAALRSGKGARPIYRAIQLGELRAAPINDRGDLRVLGAWARDWLELLERRSQITRQKKRAARG